MTSILRTDVFMLNRRDSLLKVLFKKTDFYVILLLATRRETDFKLLKKRI